MNETDFCVIKPNYCKPSLLSEKGGGELGENPVHFAPMQVGEKYVYILSVQILAPSLQEPVRNCNCVGPW